MISQTKIKISEEPEKIFFVCNCGKMAYKTDWQFLILTWRRLRSWGGGVFADLEDEKGDWIPHKRECSQKNERGYRLLAKNNHFWSLLILLLSVASIRWKLLKTTYTEVRSVHTNQKVAIYDSYHKIINSISNKSFRCYKLKSSIYFRRIVYM